MAVLPNVLLSDGRTVPWDRERIIETLMRESGLAANEFDIKPCPREIANDIGMRVEATLLKNEFGGTVTSHLIRELVCNQLSMHGMDTWAWACSRVGMSVYDACAIDIGTGYNARDNANQICPPEKSHKDKADMISKQQNLALFPPNVRQMHIEGVLHIHDLEYFRTRIFCSDYDLRWLYYYGLTPSGNPATSAVARPAKNAEVAILQAVKLLGAAQTNCAGGQGFYNFLTFLAPYLKGKDYCEIKQLMQMFVYEMMQMFCARGGQSLIYDEPIITRDKNGVNIAPIGELCHRYLNDAGSVAVDDEIEVMSLNKSTGEFEWKPLTAVHIHIPATPIVRTVLRDGRHVTTTSDHSLFTLAPDNSFVEVSPANTPSHIIAAYNLPDTSTNQVVDLDLAFLIGTCIGDGNLADNNGIENSSMRIVSCDTAVRDRIRTTLTKFGKPLINWHDDVRTIAKYGSFSTSGLPYITDIGRGAANKKIPARLLAGSNDVLRELLDGILSADGAVSRNRYELSTTSEALAAQVQYIALRLGLQFGISKRNTKSNFKRNHPVIRILFNAVSSRKITVTNSSRQIDTSKPAGPDQTNHDFSVIRNLLRDEYGPKFWETMNGFRGKVVRMKRCHIEAISKYVPDIFNKIKNILPMEVKAVTNAETPEHVYDVSVADNENFVLANGIVAHNTVFSSVQLSPGVPKIWRDQHPVYMGAQWMTETYWDYEREVRIAFQALMEVMLEGDANEKPFAFPKPEISLEPCFVEPDDIIKRFDEAHPWLPSYEDLYMLSAKLAAKFGTPYFDNQMPEYRGAGDGISCYQCCAYQFAKTTADDPDFKEKLDFKNGKHFSMGSNMVISLNLPRMAYVCEGDLDCTIAQLTRLMDWCVEVFKIKQRVIKQLVNAGRLPFLSQSPPDIMRDVLPGGRLVDFESLVYTIGIVGLDDMIKACTGKRMYEDTDSLQEGIRTVIELKEYAAHLTKKHGIEIALARTPAETTAQRFAVKDLFSSNENISWRARYCVQGDIEAAAKAYQRGERDLPIYYTNGTHVPPAAPVNLPGRIDLEQKFFPVLDGGNIMHVWLGESQPDPKGLYDLIMLIAKNTQTGYFAFTKDFTVCSLCGYIESVLLDYCDKCGSHDVDHISRITGYLSAVSGWNAGKRQELKDRHRLYGVSVRSGGQA